MKILKSKRGEIAVESAVIIVLAVFVAAFAFHVFAVFTAKQQLDTYAGELCRTAATAGRVGDETDKRESELKDSTGLSPAVSWSKTGEIQLDEKVSVTCSVTKEIGLFGGFASFPVTLTANASGRSEVYWK